MTDVWGRLVSLNPAHVHLDLSKSEVSFGREEDNAVSFPNDKLISGRHCRVFRDKDGVVFVEDLSSNGTYVNGVRVGKGKQTTLKDGDELSLVVPNAFIAQRKAITEKTFISYVLKLEAPAVPATPSGPDAVYEFKKELGSGNFATVKLAVHRQTGEKFAIKVIDKKKFALNPSLRKDQLMDEVNIMKKLRHPNIIAVHDIFEQGDNLYIVLEYAAGGDLFDSVVARTRYSEDDARQCFAQLTSAVGYLHDNGIAHRDLKPENILVDQSAGIKLSDFGLSKIFGEEQVMKTLCGTPQYLAPEIVFASEGKGQGGYSKAVDVWSMGVILYILLAGFPPFDSNSFDKIKKGSFSFAYDEWKTVSKEAKNLISKLLTVSPAKRLTCAQIFEHPWMKGVERVYGDVIPGLRKSEESKPATDPDAEDAADDRALSASSDSADGADKKRKRDPERESSSTSKR